MPTNGLASVHMAASIMPWRAQLVPEWLDLDDGNTHAIVTHEHTFSDRMKRLFLRAHPKVAHNFSVAP